MHANCSPLAKLQRREPAFEAALHRGKPVDDSAPSRMTCNRIHVKTRPSVATRNDS